MKIPGNGEGQVLRPTPGTQARLGATSPAADGRSGSSHNAASATSTAAGGQNSGGIARRESALKNYPLAGLNELNTVLDNKHEVQKLAVGLSRMEATTDQQTYQAALAKNRAVFKLGADTGLESAFDNEQSLLLRTLTSNDDNEVALRATRYGRSGKTPARREAHTLNNAVSSRNTVIVPTTLINKNVRSNTIAQLGSTRPRWAGLPSTISQPLVSTDADVQKLHDRPGFGDIHSFESSKGFTKKFVEHSPTLSHSEQMEFLKKETDGFIKDDPFRQDKSFAGSLNELEKKLIARQEHTPAESLRHNEYCARLELWDTKAIEIGHHRDVAIATMIEFNLEMHALRRKFENEGEGIQSKNFTSHVERQLSWPTSPDTDLLDKNAVTKALNAYPSEKKEQALADILQRLKNGVTLCTYEHTESGSKIRSLAIENFSKEDVVAGIKLFLSSKLQKDGAEVAPLREND